MVRPLVGQRPTQSPILHWQGEGASPVVEGFAQLVDRHLFHGKQHHGLDAGRNLTTGHHPAARRLEVVLSTRETQSGKGIKGLTQQRMPQVQQYGVRRRAEYWSTIEVMDKEAV